MSDPAGAQSDAGGISSGTTVPPSTPSTGTPSTPSAAAPEPTIVMSSGSLTLRTPSVGLLGHTLSFSGSTTAARQRRNILIERLETTTGSWVQAASAPINKKGSFLAHWRTNLSGRVSIRAVVSSSLSAQAASSESSEATQITIYRPAIATYFGPGFYGKQTACGQTLTPITLGVASRTLPCGTLVEVSYGGHRLTVPVIDRGPFANSASWDLTEAAAQALDIGETVAIGTLLAGSTPNIPTLGLPPGSSETAITQTGGSPV
jgi:rare lipoprotein A (peptidoglycan hydrolase)